MEKSYLEKIQIHKENKLAGLHPGAKLWMVILYTVCTFILNSIHLTEVGLSLAVIPWFLDSMCCKWSNEKVRESI